MPDVLQDLAQELRALNPDLLKLTETRDSTARLLEDLPSRFSPQEVGNTGSQQRAWELIGLLHLHTGRIHEALALFWRLYQHMLAAQIGGQRVHKGMPLVWISDCFLQLRCPVHAKRYLLLTLCEDAIEGKGTIPPDFTGAYFRLVWRGLPDREFRRYAARFWELASADPKAAMYPEALLQRVDDDWLTEVPSATEAFVYLANESYITWLLGQLGESRGEALGNL